MTSWRFHLFLANVPSTPRLWKHAIATGWANDGAVQDQIDDTVADAMKRARAHLHPNALNTPALTTGIECGEQIPERRRTALPGIRTCVPC